MDYYQLQGKLEGLEAIDVIESLLTPEELQGFYKGNCLKYLLRAGRKPGNELVSDLSKLCDYGNRWIESQKQQ